jgi:hypothetical protein
LTKKLPMETSYRAENQVIVPPDGVVRGAVSLFDRADAREFE